MTSDSNFWPRNKVYRTPGDKQVISRIWHPIGKTSFFRRTSEKVSYFLLFDIFMCILFYDCSAQARSPTFFSAPHICRDTCLSARWLYCKWDIRNLVCVCVWRKMPDEGGKKNAKPRWVLTQPIHEKAAFEDHLFLWLFNKLGPYAWVQKCNIKFKLESSNTIFRCINARVWSSWEVY